MFMEKKHPLVGLLIISAQSESKFDSACSEEKKKHYKKWIHMIRHDNQEHKKMIWMHLEKKMVE